jgi:hypothetical protein
MMRESFLAAMFLVLVVAVFAAIVSPELFAGAGGLAMAIPVKDAAAAAKKFVARGMAAGADYAAGVRGSGERWKAGAKAGKDNFVQGIQEAIQRNAYEKGVDQAGANKYEERATTVGANRFPQGIQQSENAWMQNTQPYLTVIAGVNLPPRGPKGSPQNQARSAAMADAMRRKKIGG